MAPGKALPAPELPRVWWQVAINGEDAGRITMELRTDIAPITCENFKALCTGERGMGKSGKRLHYKGSYMHRIVSDFMAQAGDFTAGDGTGGESIYGPKFPDENFRLRHDTPGVLSMANAGPNTNGSQVFLTFQPAPWLDGKHVVFGRIVEGMPVLKRVEVCGSRSGKPTKRVQITDCGQLATRSEMLMKVMQEKEELAALRQNPLQVDPDAEARKRLAEMKAQLAAVSGGAAAQAGSQAQDSDQGPASSQAQPPASSASGEQQQQQQEHQGDTDSGDEEPDPAQLEGLSVRQRKLLELRQKLGQCRKANQAAVIAERKRNKTLPAEPDDEAPAAKRKWFEEKQKRKAEELARLGLDPTQGHRLETAEQAGLQYRKQEQKAANVELAALHATDSRRQYQMYERMTTQAAISKDEYDAAKAQDPDFYRSADSLQYGKAPKLATENVDRLVHSLEARQNAGNNYSRRRTFRDAKDVDYINDRNAHFNKKIERAFGQYTQEIKANLERGTALPDR